jgi:hypothetical protein
MKAREFAVCHRVNWRNIAFTLTTRPLGVLSEIA